MQKTILLLIFLLWGCKKRSTNVEFFTSDEWRKEYIGSSNNKPMYEDIGVIYVVSNPPGNFKYFLETILKNNIIRECPNVSGNYSEKYTFYRETNSLNQDFKPSDGDSEWSFKERSQFSNYIKDRIGTITMICLNGKEIYFECRFYNDISLKAIFLKYDTQERKKGWYYF